MRERKHWAETNLALGRRIKESMIESECEQMAPDTFARERPGWWASVVEKKGDMAIDLEAWATCASDEGKPEGKTATVHSIPRMDPRSFCAALCAREKVLHESTEIDRKIAGHGTQ